MYAIERDGLLRRFARRALALLGLITLLFAAGLDSAQASTTALDAAAISATAWLAFALLAIIAFVVFRRSVPSRARRAAINRRRSVARVRRR